MSDKLSYSNVPVPTMDEYFRHMQLSNASDLYLTAGRPAVFRGDLGVTEYGLVLDENLIRKNLLQILSPELMEKFKQSKELNLSLDKGKLGRFRVNLLQQKNMPAVVIRRIISDIPDFEALGLPELFKALSLEKRGLILVTGVTASGKSTTLASMLNYRNEHEAGHIITIEDPIEYFHQHKKSIITQREVGIDTHSFADALKNALRQRPDVRLIGEIRDREVMQHALNISETGHLSLATLHTTNAYQSLERIINFYPEGMAAQIRMSLSLNLRAIVSQRLVPSIDGSLVLAQEIMLNEGLIRDLIASGETAKIRQLIEDNNANGMCSFDQSLRTLYAAGRITKDVAIAYADIPGDLKLKLDRVKQGTANYKGGLSSVDTSTLTLSDDI